MGDSDLFSQSLIHPCSQNQALLRKQQKDRRVIPGPAGMVQAAMHRPETQLVHVAGGGGCGDEDDDSVDADFFLNPWLSALEYLGIGRNYLTTQTNSCITSIKTHRTPHRAQQVVGIVISCRPNTVGGMFIVLKDPTGSIAASIHHKLLAENRELGVGCVVVLKQVVVFPIRTSSYLNITPNNMVKLFSKDCDLPITRPIAYGIENEEEHNVRTITKSGKMANDNYPDVSKVMEVTESRTSRSEVILPQMQIPRVFSASVVTEWTDDEINEVFSDYLEDDDLNRTPNKTVKLVSKDCGFPSQMSPIATPIPCGKENKEDSRRNTAKCPKIVNDKYPEVCSKVMEVADAGTNSNEVILPKMQIPKVLSASVTEWSDAQINELFSDYPDDSDELEKFLL